MFKRMVRQAHYKMFRQAHYKIAIAVIIFALTVMPAQADTKVLFSPGGGTSKALINLYNGARSDIKVATYAFTAKYQANALIAAQQRGVKVQVFLDEKIGKQKTSMSWVLAKAGVPLHYFTPVGGAMHHKFIIVDGKSVATGSYNLSNDAEFRSNEAMLFITDAGVVAAFVKEFDRLWNMGK